MRKMSIFFIGLLLLVTGLTGCGSEESKHDNHDDQQQVMGDLQETTASKEALPSFLDNKHEDIQTIYQGAAQHKELLEQMPCYCGCGDSVGHMNNYDCFIHDQDNQSVVWDDHGTKCNVCLEIAAKAMIEYSKGQSVKDIRHMIDEAYKEGYAPPTPTPPVS
ncbi:MULTISPECIES: PCYCGC domain-containing protein [Pontibacillus]|uniref:PCYCGC domain-containing protein n=1 Tax=Pontibacillus chungwhensis TaxID=265426 RepID=A0ABY8UV76_9BACI|nr:MULTISPECIES: PCYCGC domain-containing protein [Pontibacillus]MCD5325134.1 PCYCGC domain-containing protein [Pontibacillus sp. HN14]WIF97384.1 PCYCGC domain-containing protein [Pontibacillus chungwhensis]